MLLGQDSFIGVYRLKTFALSLITRTVGERSKFQSTLTAPTARSDRAFLIALRSNISHCSGVSSFAILSKSFSGGVVIGEPASSGYVLCYSQLLAPGDPSTKEVTIVGLADPQDICSHKLSLWSQGSISERSAPNGSE